jgi:hypothetical protein
MSSANDEFEWPRLLETGWRIGPYDAHLSQCDPVLDGLSNLGRALALVGALATAALASLQAGIDMGMELVAEQMRQDAMRQAVKGKSNILVPSRQLILPGIK